MSGPKKSKKRPLRPPFLITVVTLAGALVPGCGGAETSNATRPDGATNCPAAEPANGSSCETAGQVCEYPWCGGLSMQVKCVAGKWSVSGGGCNPPPVPQCPATEPQAGTDCVAWTPQPCSYPNAPLGTNDYVCSGSKWTKNEPAIDAGSEVSTPREDSGPD
jgi:hypothetical protein